MYQKLNYLFLVLCFMLSLPSCDSFSEQEDDMMEEATVEALIT